ncbi:uncharacterized protein NPIL_150781 [Nephila pilipes]|uniref:Uncharacterized protein n=1 Tax=Nephila pilipes TaxID=299642 RepID=A0A8X6NJ47_NEPPI|nr:uncharacterized protein NPIL_150781 [Nephila pilipes]
MSPPILQDFKNIREALKYISQNFEFISENWEFPVLKDADVIWSIAVAYLNSSPPSKNELTRRLNSLVGHQKTTKDLRNFTNVTNPFLHRTACFGDEFMIDLVKTLKNQLEDWIHQAGNLLEILSEKEKYLEASSRFLECNIMFCSFENNEGNLHIFPKCPPYFIYPKYILLLHWPRKAEYNDSFSYCIPKDVGILKQKLALTEILEKATISKKIIQKICGLPNICENFLITLLKNNLEQHVPLIYKSLYVLSKLSDAGFETDPRQKDREGKSALYYALMKDKTDILFFLYDHAANACLQEQGSIRSPDTSIVANLQLLKDSLQTLEKDIKYLGINENSEFLRKLDELQLYNLFQIEMCGKINNVRQEINYYSKTDEEFEAISRRKIILNILETYGKYFNCVNNSALNATDNLSLAEKYYQNRNYFDKLDFYSAVMFFDNLFLLKERLKLLDKAYLKIESKFFLYIFCKKHLEQSYQENEFIQGSRRIIFQEQLSLQKHLCAFKFFLDKTEISRENIVSSIPETQVNTLVNLPEIYGRFILYRLQNYIDTVAKIKIMDAKSILIIERSLQVIGESFKESNFKSIQKVLSQAFPSEFVKIVKQIRNNLVHFKSSELLYRNTVEHNSKLLKGIQTELVKFKKLLSPISFTHMYEMGQFLSLRLLKALYKAWKKEKNIKQTEKMSEEKDCKIHVSELLIEKQQLRSVNVNSPQESDMYNSFQKKIKILNQEVDFLKKDALNSYKYITVNLISAVKDKLSSLKSESVITDQDTEKLDDLFWSLECVLISLTKNKKLQKYRRTLLNRIKDRKCFFPEKIRGSGKINKCIYSTCNVISETEILEVGQSQVLNYLEPSVESYDMKVQTIVQNGILLNGAENYKNSTIVVETEKKNRASIDIEDIGLNAFFSDDSSYNTFQNENEKKSLDPNIEMIEPQLLFKAKQYETDIDVPSNVHSLEPHIDSNLLYDKDITMRCEENECLGTNAEDSEKVSTQPDPIEKSNVAMDSEWILNDVFNTSQDSIINDEVKNKGNKGDLEASNILIKNAESVVADYENILEGIFEKVKEKKEEEFSYKNIKKYCMILKGWPFLNDEEVRTIYHCIPAQFHDISPTKQRLRTLLEGKQICIEETIKELNKLPLKDQEKREIIKDIEEGTTAEALYSIDSIPDYFSDLKNKIDSAEMNKMEYDLLCNKLKMSDAAKTILSKLVIGENQKVIGNEFEFFRNRIKLLKKILIDENEDIKELWEKPTSLRRQKHLHDKLVQMYVNVSEVQAAVEMLVSDCMNVLHIKDLEKLWLKITRLFNGTNLRNILAHGNPLLESLGKLLDLNDLPSELVTRMLRFISDEPAIDCMQTILEQTGYQFSNFMKLMKDDDDERFKDLRQKITECEHWSEYACLIPMGKCKAFSGIQ